MTDARIMDNLSSVTCSESDHKDDDSVFHSEDACPPSCTTRLTIFRSPTPRTNDRSHGLSQPQLSFRSPSNHRSLAFPLNLGSTRSSSASFGPDPHAPIEEATPDTHPRVPTKVLQTHEVHAQLQCLTGEVLAEDQEANLAAPDVPSVGIPGADHQVNDGDDAPTEMEPLNLVPLDDEHQLPFADREEEVWALLHHPCNTALTGRLERLSSGTIWPKLAAKLKESRQVRPDPLWIADLEQLVKIEGQDVFAWVQLRGVLGADDIGHAPLHEPELLLIDSFDEGESVIVAPALSQSIAALPSSKVARPTSGSSKESDIFGTRRLDRKNSLDSVFFSDSGSEAGGPPHSPGVSAMLTMTPSQPGPSLCMSPLSKVDDHSASPSIKRHHPRSRSHGGAVAAGGPIMQCINEDEVLDEASPSPSTTLSRAHSSGSMSSRMMGLRVLAMTPRTTSPVALDADEEDVDDMASARKARGRLRYSFGAVDAERHGLGLGAGGSREEE